MKNERFAMVICLGLAACATVPNLGPKAELRSAQSYAAEKALATAKADQTPATGGWLSESWWKSFADEQLERMLPAHFSKRSRTKRSCCATMYWALDIDDSFGGAVLTSTPDTMPHKPTPERLRYQ
jgi:hypothetical protein